MFLEEAVRSTRERVAWSRQEVPEAELRARAREAPPPRDFVGALAHPGIALIAEVKRRSPSRGAL
ncbi:MAG: indole-3-glycerol-phosphate synthase TrpC, partial [Chloroflexia bacterium]